MEDEAQQSGRTFLSNTFTRLVQLDHARFVFGCASNSPSEPSLPHHGVRSDHFLDRLRIADVNVASILEGVHFLADDIGVHAYRPCE